VQRFEHFFSQINVYRNVNVVSPHVLALFPPVVSWNTCKELQVVKSRSVMKFTSDVVLTPAENFRCF